MRIRATRRSLGKPRKLFFTDVEVLDGQQRITSFTRFVAESNPFSVVGSDGKPHHFSFLPTDQKARIAGTRLTIYVCEGTEAEIKEWFQTINIAGVKLTPQESKRTRPMPVSAIRRHSSARSAGSRTRCRWAQTP